MALSLLGALTSCGESKTRSSDSATTEPAATSQTAGTPTTLAEPPTVISPTTAASASQSLPISVESDTAMRAAGNEGPSSSSLLPASCQVTGSIATATGDYQGGIPPEIYHRYGDVVELYVFSAAVSGYPQGIQVATLSSEHPPAIGGSGTWTVIVPVQSSPEPARCAVAAQPTHDFQGAPSAY